MVKVSLTSLIGPGTSPKLTLDQFAYTSSHKPSPSSNLTKSTVFSHPVHDLHGKLFGGPGIKIAGRFCSAIA